MPKTSISVADIFTAMRTAVVSHNEQDYRHVLNVISRSNYALARSEPEEFADFASVIGQLDFENPPCGVKDWSAGWYQFFTYFVHAAPVEYTEPSALRHWHLLWLPALLHVMSGTAVFCEKKDESDLIRQRCQALGGMWLDGMSSVENKDFLLSVLRHVYVAPEYNFNLSFWLPLNDAGDLTQELLLALFNERDLVSAVCLVESDFGIRLDLLEQQLNGRITPSPKHLPGSF